MSPDRTRPAGARHGFHPSPNALLRTPLFGLGALLLYALIVAETVLLAYVIAAPA